MTMTSSADNDDASTSKPYLHGHHASVLRSHSSRTARNSCPHLLPHLRRGMRVLDVGCGPGTITTDLATIVAGPAASSPSDSNSPNTNDSSSGGGHVIGVDYSASVLAVARAHAERAGVSSNAISFWQADAYALPFADGAFDVVHANQVVQHVADPVRAVREMRRVARPDGGIVALREGDAQVWFCPEEDEPGKVLGEWYELWLRMARDAGLEPNAGRRLLSYALQAGFRPEEVSAGVGSECWGNKDELRELCGMRADRVVMSEFAEHAVGRGYTTREGLERLNAAWRQFAELDGAWYAMMQGRRLLYDPGSK